MSTAANITPHGANRSANRGTKVVRYDYLVKGSFKFFRPGPDGKVRRASVLVRLTDEDGVQGIGQAVPIPTWTYETPETVVATLKKTSSPRH